MNEHRCTYGLKKGSSVLLHTALLALRYLNNPYRIYRGLMKLSLTLSLPGRHPVSELKLIKSVKYDKIRKDEIADYNDIVMTGFIG